MNTSLSTTDDAMNTVKTELTPPKPRQTVENKEFAAFAKRILRAYSKRVANGDIEALPELIDLAEALSDAVNGAVVGLREFGYSWAEIAARVGVSKQAAQQRWGATGNRTAANGQFENALFGDEFFPGAPDDYA